MSVTTVDIIRSGCIPLSQLIEHLQMIEEAAHENGIEKPDIQFRMSDKRGDYTCGYWIPAESFRLTLDSEETGIVDACLCFFSIDVHTEVIPHVSIRTRR